MEAGTHSRTPSVMCWLPAQPDFAHVRYTKTKARAHTLAHATYSYDAMLVQPPTRLVGQIVSSIPISGKPLASFISNHIE